MVLIKPPCRSEFLGSLQNTRAQCVFVHHLCTGGVRSGRPRYQQNSVALHCSHARQLRPLSKDRLRRICWCQASDQDANDRVEKPWTPTAKAAAFTGLYILTAGVGLLLAPETLFGLLFSTRDMSTGWLRVGGTLAALYGFYYLGAAFGERSGSGLRGFYMSTVLGRLLLSLIFVCLRIEEQGRQGLLILAAINAAGAFSMWKALHSGG